MRDPLYIRTVYLFTICLLSMLLISLQTNNDQVQNR